MSKNLFFVFLLCTLFFISCKKDGDDPIVYDYHAHIQQPSGADKVMGDLLFIDVEFESHSGENVEHIKVRIFNKAETIEVYNEPDNPHLEGNVSDYQYTDQFALTEANGVSPGDWVIEASVWGAEDGMDEVKERVEFHIHPQ